MNTAGGQQDSDGAILFQTLAFITSHSNKQQKTYAGTVSTPAGAGKRYKALKKYSDIRT